MECTEAEGPGKRFCIWVQGCLRICPDCCNQQMQSIVPNIILRVEELCDTIIKSKQTYNIEGVTFLGGEPMLQARGLSRVAKLCKESGLSVIVFTGYTYNELLSSALDIEYTDELLRYTDVLIDGPYIKSEPDYNRNWVGSKNQKFYYLTNNYDPSIETDEKYRNLIEVTIQNEHLYVSGCPKVIKDK